MSKTIEELNQRTQNLLEQMGIKYKDMYLLCKNGDDDLIKEWLDDK